MHASTDSGSLGEPEVATRDGRDQRHLVALDEGLVALGVRPC